MSSYLDNLKKTDLRPKKIKIDESKEEVLLEQDPRGMAGEGGVEENIRELFVKTGEIQGMDKGPERDLKILRLGIIAELDAVNFYDELANLASDERVQKLMLDVSHEEKVHAGEFETLMEELDPHYEEAEEEGEKEVEDLLGS
jgi:hypothetical protein